MSIKKTVRIAAFMTAIITGAAFGATAQESTFEDNTLYGLKEKAETVSNNSVVRITTLEETFEKGARTAASSVKYINEVIPPDRSHFITEKKLKNGAVERTEYIDVGSQRYIRKNGGSWEIFKPEGRGMGSGNGSGSGSGVKVETSSENKLKRGVAVDKQKTDYYETTTTYKYLYPTGTIVKYFKEGFWFDAKGRYVKTLRENFDGETKNIDRKTTRYEYDPNIKIEAPIKIKE